MKKKKNFFLKKKSISTGSRNTTRCENKTEKQVDWKDMQLILYVLTFPPLGTKFQKIHEKSQSSEKDRKSETKRNRKEPRKERKNQNQKIQNADSENVTRKFSVMNNFTL